MSFDEILKVATDKTLIESGGGHNQKGINFQRVWAIARMLELDEEGKDFLLLFEAIQDVAEFDSERQPTRVSVYQVKKKDGAHWTWRELTGYVDVDLKKSASQPLTDVHKSVLGKLYATVMAFKDLQSDGAFVSNMGCDLALHAGGTAATTLFSDLSQLESRRFKRLSAGLATLHATGDPSPDLTRLTVKKIGIHPDAPERALIGLAHVFLKSRSPTHANQAETLVETLLAKISPLGAKTDRCASFADLRKERGYSRDEFRRALAGLEQIPDVKSLVSGWLAAWPNDPDFGLIERGRTTVELGRIFQHRLAGHADDADGPLVAALDTRLTEHPPTLDLADSLRQAKRALSASFPDVRPERFTAHFLMRAALLCADPTTDF